MKLKKLVFLGGLSSIFLTSYLTAAHADMPGIYLGGSWGAYSIDESDLDDHDKLLKAYIGGQFTPWLGVEGSWVDFNKLDNDDSYFDTDGKSLAGVFSFPFSDSSSFYVKGGELWWNSSSSLGGTVSDDDGNDVFFGAGLKLGFTERFAVRLDWERYNVSDIDLDTASVGLQYTF